MLVWYIMAGIIGVTNMILWGIYGDLEVEKFYVRKVLRSVVVGIFSSVYLYLLNPQLSLVIVALSVIFFERSFTEIYKAFIRVENQKKYLIPSDLNIKWPAPFKRALGILLLSAILLLYWSINISYDKFFLILMAGLTISVLGALKDAPYEGFQYKFFRSPLVTIVVGLLLIHFFPSVNGKYFFSAVWGGERILSECYKKIICGKIPGKFKGRKFNKLWVKIRPVVLIPYAINLFLFLVLILIG